MDCTTVAYAANGKYWFKGDNVLTTLCDGTETTDPCKKEIKDKTDAGYKYTTGPIYSCTALHKYPSLDTEIGGTYRECGDLSMDDKNSALNLCNVPTNADYGDKPLPASCLATYDATKVACQPLIASTKPPTPPAPNSCLNCPLFCRSVITSSLGSSTSLCQNKQDRGNSGWDRGGDAPYCDTGASAVCDMRTDNIPLNSPSFLPGFCGVDSNRFNLSAHDPYPQTGNGQCQWPNEGYGAACPARCRVLASDNSQELPSNCSAYADACKLDPNLPIYCRAAPPSRLCAGCIDCQTDCTARPLVRQNCQELCMPTDAMSGRTDLAPNALVSAMGGAAGNTDWRNLGNEAIAVFILPIFCILITLSFIRATSPFLGGEIELPGILKLI